ncbi:MAG: hypothetical protein M3R02_29810 [Chloroflexota bacterium]|nr:hypothetical protein [Chloroflexota bacterium]
MAQALQPATGSFGGIYAPYGGIVVTPSLAWDWWIDEVSPDRYDLLGGAIALVGVSVIMYPP